MDYLLIPSRNDANVRGEYVVYSYTVSLMAAYLNAIEQTAILLYAEMRQFLRLRPIDELL